jgi:hypothetical protein
MIIRFARAFGATTPLPEDMIEYLYSSCRNSKAFQFIDENGAVLKKARASG